ncbi:MAG: hypothetical protein LC768_08635 [Acidobacteria bacterium]|nr:hypothetical protein [Acidobacteriota bacterium]MCA1638384.1 hypothetical protein [Acidobacteriota bacterium]
MKQFRLCIATLIICVFSSVIIFAQTQERTIKLVKWRNEPLEITKLKVSGKEASFNQPFNAEGDDWFRDLTVTVKNISNQTIHFIDIGLTFYSSEAGNIPSRDHLLYGCDPPPSSEAKAPKCDQPPLKPNETTTLVLEDYQSTRKFLNETGKPQNINYFELKIGEVIFADRRMWAGEQIYNRDPNNPNRWLPEKKAQ